MTPPRASGVLLPILGVILILVALHATHAMADQIHHRRTGRLAQDTAWYLSAGLAPGVLGLVLLSTGWSRKGL